MKRAGQSKKPAWLQTTSHKPKRYDRRTRAKVRSFKGQAA